MTPSLKFSSTLIFETFDAIAQKLTNPNLYSEVGNDGWALTYSMFPKRLIDGKKKDGPLWTRRVGRTWEYRDLEPDEKEWAYTQTRII